ncbi:hypothetical protein [Aquimarina sp. AU119]|uniref:hypothetical protein n=1 Tax=Aquimarina sp. AU119 TaxID=2108528 RepID=UPI000D69E37B|nr:hypothetical protein [Aquimarina sp. AU119]
MLKKLIIGVLAVGFIAVSCSDDDDNTIVVNAGTISGGPFSFDVDGEPDLVTGISLDDTNVSGSNSTWVITDDAGTILGLPPNITAVEGVNFDDAGTGTCFIWYLRYEDGLDGLEAMSNTSDLNGTFDFSNSIEVVRNQVTNAGRISGGPFEFNVDGEADMVRGIELDDSNVFGANGTWVITDDMGTILGLPPTLADVEGVNFDGAGAGVCFIWYLRYEDGLQGLAAMNNTSDLNGTFDFSNSIEVVRNQVTNAGTLSGGPYTFCVDGMPDMVSGIMLDDTNAFGANSTWVITDDMGNILGLPPTLADVENVNFDDAGGGTCFIWYLRYEDGLQGLAAMNNTSDLVGTFDFSNSVEVVRNKPDGGTITGGPFTITVDGTPDMVSGIALDNTNVSGKNGTWVITDDTGVILGLPSTIADVENVDFNAAGVGTCFIWYLRYEDGLQGLTAMSNTSGLDGCYDFSNSIEVTRNPVP